MFGQHPKHVSALMILFNKRKLTSLLKKNHVMIQICIESHITRRLANQQVIMGHNAFNMIRSKLKKKARKRIHISKYTRCYLFYDSYASHRSTSPTSVSTIGIPVNTASAQNKMTGCSNRRYEPVQVDKVFDRV